MSRAIAMLGAPGAGVTTTAVQLAAQLSAGSMTTVLLVLCDAALPPKGYLMADTTRAESIGGQLVQAGGTERQRTAAGGGAGQRLLWYDGV